MARPEKCRCICSIPKYLEFSPNESTGEVTVKLDEYEVFRLLNLEKKSQEQCAERMNISRATVARINESVCAKLADALTNGKKILIVGGDVEVCLQRKPECANEKHCCHNFEQ